MENHSKYSEKMESVEYFRQVKALLKAGRQKEAFNLLQTAVMHFPNEPVLLSYYGCLLAIVDRKYRTGIETCQKAIQKLWAFEVVNERMVYSLCYYNLGKAYSVAGKRKESLNALIIGLSYDPGNTEILKELRSMRMRSKKPPVPFLDRTNLLNKYLGIILYRRDNKRFL